MKTELQNLIKDCSSEMDDIESRINLIKKSNPLDKEIRYLTNYALIRTEGTAELVYRTIVTDYFSEKFSDNKIDTYLGFTIKQGSQSATYDNMQKLLNKFDKTWHDNFQQAVQNDLDGEKMIGASKSLVNNRHWFAHGKNTTATFKDIKQYYEDVLKLINIFDSVVNS